jgi:hypothetical protein
METLNTFVERQKAKGKEKEEVSNVEKLERKVVTNQIKNALNIEDLKKSILDIIDQSRVYKDIETKKKGLYFKRKWIEEQKEKNKKFSMLWAKKCRSFRASNRFSPYNIKNYLKVCEGEEDQLMMLDTLENFKKKHSDIATQELQVEKEEIELDRSFVAPIREIKYVLSPDFDGTCHICTEDCMRKTEVKCGECFKRICLVCFESLKNTVEETEEHYRSFKKCPHCNAIFLESIIECKN